jgi:hypothetical protein
MYICTSSTLPIEAKGSPTGCPSLTPSHTGRKLCYMAAWLRRVACSMMQSIYCCLGEVHDKPKDGKPRYSKVKCMPCVFHIGDSKESGLSCRHGRRRDHAWGACGALKGPIPTERRCSPTAAPGQHTRVPKTWDPPVGIYTYMYTYTHSTPNNQIHLGSKYLSPCVERLFAIVLACSI